MDPSQPTPGWYPDPDPASTGGERYWDGDAWTTLRRSGMASSVAGRGPWRPAAAGPARAAAAGGHWTTPPPSGRGPAQQTSAAGLRYTVQPVSPTRAALGRLGRVVLVLAVVGGLVAAAVLVGPRVVRAVTGSGDGGDVAAGGAGPDGAGASTVPAAWRNEATPFLGFTMDVFGPEARRRSPSQVLSPAAPAAAPNLVEYVGDGLETGVSEIRVEGIPVDEGWVRDSWLGRGLDGPLTNVSATPVRSPHGDPAVRIEGDFRGTRANGFAVVRTRRDGAVSVLVVLVGDVGGGGRAPLAAQRMFESVLPTA